MSIIRGSSHLVSFQQTSGQCESPRAACSSSQSVPYCRSCRLAKLHATDSHGVGLVVSGQCGRFRAACSSSHSVRFCRGGLLKFQAMVPMDSNWSCFDNASLPSGLQHLFGVSFNQNLDNVSLPKFGQREHLSSGL